MEDENQSKHEPANGIKSDVIGSAWTCTLSDKDLIEKTKTLLGKLCETGGRAWTMRVPAEPNNDSDLLISELITRFERHCQ